MEGKLYERILYTNRKAIKNDIYKLRHSKRDVFLIFKQVPASFNKMAYLTFRNIMLQ